ncbi:hypothetical protein RintRC_6239 [Richelia intracellularis]|nr:hypothetical protein RintRC_6239 [Richelia intracellularis]
MKANLEKSQKEGAMEAEQLLKLYQEKRRDFSWVNLRDPILNQVQLSQANFSRAKLMGHDLKV